MQERQVLDQITKISERSMKQAAKILAEGGLVALPTETVYGLAAHAENDRAVTRIYEVKGRPAHNPLILHVFDPQDAKHWVKINEMAKSLIDIFWPGPLTLVLPKAQNEISPTAGAGLQTLAIRCPKAVWTKAFKNAGFLGPIVMPSANRSGHISPTEALHVAEDLGRTVDLILDAGPCPDGIESTILKIETDHAVLLRPGAIPIEAFVPYISDLRLPVSTAKVSAPGMLKSHYAPKAKVRLNAKSKFPGEAYLAFGATKEDSDFNLSPTGDLAEAAQNLYKALRLLDNVEAISIAPIPETGLGAAINDRLRRAAADKDS